MTKRKTLKELTLKDPFMFAAVMSDPENCTGLLELVLDMPIDHVEVNTEQTMVYHPDFHGVRLDVYAKTPEGSRFDVEMQVGTTAIERRTRYYHSHLDMDLLKTGCFYEDLPEVYVIFICDYDPFGDEKYVYTVDQRLRESGRMYKDGRHSIFLSTYGKNKAEVSPGLVNFLEYVHADLQDSETESGDPYVSRLQDSVKRIKVDREQEVKHMLFEDMMRMERKEGKEEGLKEGRKEGLKEGLKEGACDGKRDSLLLILASKGTVADSLRERLLRVTDPEVLDQYLRLAIAAGTVDEFAERFGEAAADND